MFRFFVLALVFVVVYNFYSSKPEVELSDLVKANIEALAHIEGATPFGGPKSEYTGNCMSQNTVNCKDLSGCQ